jgi:hypothetical protein
MATVYKEIEIGRSKEFVWDAIRDVGAIHKRLVRGFVVDCTLEGDVRTVTFSNGMVVRELIVAVDDATCRHSWGTHDKPFVHYNASVQAFSSGPDKCRVVWIADFLPNELVDLIAGLMQQGLIAMKQTLESSPVEAGERKKC